ncbi:MAG TPA: response regulator [Candidatus Limnocylindrales bacterium]|nr:response regulator [Candidatus Limnocylindrales bacterium]
MSDPAPNAAPTMPGRVLVADDSAVNRMVLGRLLAGLGHDVVEASDGTQALEILGGAGDRIDIVLLDLVMPGKDGFEVLATMKADAALATLPVIVISDLDDLDSIVRCVEMGATDFLPRPIKPTLLRARVDASLADKRLRDQVHSLLSMVERQRTELARFLSPQVAALVSSSDGEQLLAGHRRAITAVFCDLRGFTSFTETAEPEELLGVLREYHGAMGRRIVEHEGTLEHFAGDGMFVFFNDPVVQDDHMLRGVRMAVAMRDDMAGLTAAWRKRGYELGFGVGIAVGHATLGRIGFEGRHDYGALGNVVVLASRLSSQALPGQILLSQRAFATVEEAVIAEPVEGLVLKGMSHPVTAWNVTALTEESAVA